MNKKDWNGPYHITTGGDSHWEREVRDKDGRGIAFCGCDGGQVHARMIVEALNRAAPPGDPEA